MKVAINKGKKLVKKPAKKAVKKKAARVNGGQYSEVKQKFTALKPLVLVQFPNSVAKMPKSYRPYISKIAAENGLKYVTIPVGDEDMFVIRYSTKK